MKSRVYQKIMIATDGSQNSMKAVASGIEIAKLSGAKVYAVYVVDTSYKKYLADFKDKEKVHEYLVNQGKDAISHVEKAGEMKDVQVEPVIVEGNPAVEIVNYAEKNDMDMIVMGTMGVTASRKLSIGSVAENVVRTSKVQVLVVQRYTPTSQNNE
ncbi:UspA domain protein [Methanosalsum zhilinae DSM 4017]|uniref:UspA domain protein n=1 Tax=Methanosalsum zhilinae (strain DSM 4017 / NBRC 107636 / OCM 62 / WeN5) TaxID=679901 RepID=F7XL33_METZD|nr:universal stress protein [Methanosalsum zhilinae]AEH61845.1 UspA domain protein [Methanosalsum zhilinae DSM 4017]